MTDGYFPYVFDLSSGNVQRIQTSAVDPRVIFDRFGLRGTAADGTFIIDIDAITGAASFRGVVTASGLILPTGTTPSPPAVNRIQWARQSDGAVTAQMYGWESVDHDVLQLDATAADSFHIGQALLRASSADTLRFAFISTNAAQLGGADTDTAVDVNTQGFGSAPSARLLDAAGNSSFVTRPFRGAGTTSLNTGTVPITWATSAQSNIATVFHGIGRAVVPIPILNGNPSGFNLTPGVFNVTPTSFQIAVTASAVLNTTVTYFWFAIG